MLKVTEATIDLEKTTKESAKAVRIYGEDSLQAREAALDMAKAQENLEKAMAGGKTELTAAEKAQASYALIMEQTTLAQGDFERTSGGLANQQRIMKATFEDLKTTLGGELLPIVTQVATAINEWLSDPAVAAGLTALVDGIANFAQKVVDFIPIALAKFREVGAWFMEHEGIIVGILAVIGVAVMAFAITTAAAAVTAMAPLLPVILILAAVGVAAYLLYEAWKNNFGGIQDKVKAVWAFLQPIFALIVDWFRVAIPMAIQILAGFWNNVLLPAIQRVQQWSATYLLPLFEALGTLLKVTLGLALTALAGFWEKVLWPAIKKVAEWVNDKLVPILKTVVSWIGEKLSPAFDGISGAISTVIGWIQTLTTKLSSIKLPDWLTPGSPTPFEIGLVGISRAMHDLTIAQLPALTAGLNISGGIPSGPTAATGNRADNRVAGLLEQILNKQVLDDDKLARSIRDAILQVI